MQLDSLLLDFAHKILDLLLLAISLLILQKWTLLLAAHGAKRLAHMAGEIVLRGLVECVVELLRGLMGVAK